MENKEHFFDEDVSGCVISLLGHVAIILSLALVSVEVPERSSVSLTVLSPSEEEFFESPAEFVVGEVSTEIPGAMGDDGFELSVLGLDVPGVVPEIEIGAEFRESSLEIPLSDLASNVSARGEFSGVSARGAEGVMDILAAEIEASLDRRPTVVCWVFDRSLSLSEQREEIADRLENVFGQVSKDGLRNVVVSFGEGVDFVVKSPTEESLPVVRAIREIPVDESGKEMTFHAVLATAELARSYRSNPRNNVMIVVFTDEVGDDRDMCDKAAHYCHTMGVPVYVVGVPAPFGTEEVRIKFEERDPNYSKQTQWAVVNQGPESAFPEFVKLPKDEAVDSGFGPYHLSRLCVVTGGIYFRIHPNGDSRDRVSNEQVGRMASQIRRFFDPSVMSGYRPDYRSWAKIEQEVKSDRCKSALVMAAAESVIRPLESPRLVFPKRDEASLALLFGEAQKAAALVQPKIDRIYSILKGGEGERDSLEGKRWRAGYDLSLGRILAAKVRADSYNLMLAQAKSGLKFNDPESDTWELVPSDKVSVGSKTEKEAAQAKLILERVRDEHPGTPWAYYALEELKTPLGYEWVERKTGVQKEGMGGGGGGNPAMEDDKRKMLAPPLPVRKLKNI